MSVNDPSLLHVGSAESTEAFPPISDFQTKKTGNGHPKASFESVEVDAEGRLSKPAEPTLTAPPKETEYPEASFEAPPELALPPAKAAPIVLRRQVSGTYSGVAGTFKLELRVDVDRARTLNTASFDFYTVGSVVNHFGSFRLVSPVISYGATAVTIKGGITGTTTVWADRVVITVNRNLILQPAAPAQVTFFRGTVQGTIYSCPAVGPYFRSVFLETDCEVGTALFSSYNTNELPCPAPHRILTTIKAYEEAGVQMVMTGANNNIVSAEAGPDARWTETEMHASMVNHFSKYANLPQWAVWLFAARRAVSNGLLGIMFDYLPGLKKHRQGCAVFQDSIRSFHPIDAEYRRHLLYTYVHELGHAFNLLHSWDKARPSSLSWMNYDWKYDQIHGFGSFWNNFNFIFDNGELLHLRHGFRANVIMGGNDWAVGAGLEGPETKAASVFEQDMIENNSGLKIEVAPVKKSYALGEPVVIELKLRCMDLNGKVVNTNLHPRNDHVRIGILKPNGKVMMYEPLAHNCSVAEMQELTPESNTAYASSYIGYGKEGFYFDQPGMYRIKAAYQCNDGSVLQSEEVAIRVKSPVTQTEDNIADVYFGSDVGACFYLLGSDSEVLKKGMDDLKLVSDKYKTNELSIYADFVLGVNDAMKFKIADAKSQKVVTRERDISQAKTRLSKVFNASKGSEGLDNITLNWTYRHFAKACLIEKDEKTAKATLKDMEETFKQKKLKPAVQQKIAAQAKSVLEKNK